MLRQAIACVAYLTPALVFSTVQGCGDQPDPEDLCLWLTDPNGCYVRFADDYDNRARDAAINVYGPASTPDSP